MSRSASSRKTTRSRNRASALGLLWLLLGGSGPIWLCVAVQPAEAAASAPAPTVSGRLPLTVTLPPSVTTPEEARPFFDAFSWQSFIALNWPAAPYPARGVPAKPDDPAVFTGAPAGAHPVVWGTYKEEFELFDQGDHRPAAWESPEIPVNPCGGTRAGHRIFVRHSKGDSLVEEANQAFSYPLIDQHRQYAVYEVRFNRTQYDFVRGRDEAPTSWLYLARNLAAREPVSMPASHPPSTQGALMVKAAWKILDRKRDDERRFYSIDALVLDPADGRCKPHRVGLVGLHIVQKLAAFPQWIWSSFEQVDNVPADHGVRGHRRYSFNNGTADPPTVGGWADRPPDKAPKLQPVKERKPVQVTRFNPIPESTRELNRTVRERILQGTVWRHYQLIITQWPSTPLVFKTMENGGIYPRDSGGAFPPNGATNAVMETYLQSEADAHGAGGNSCMSCHYVAGQADFSWTLMRGAH